MNNQQAALIAAASQVRLPEGRGPAVLDQVRVETLLLAAHYITWLDQQDELEAKLRTVLPEVTKVAQRIGGIDWFKVLDHLEAKLKD